MQFQLFTIPAFDFDTALAELNTFLRSHRVVSIQKEFVSSGSQSFWSVLVEYLEQGGSVSQSQIKSKSKVDYRELLPEKEFALYSKLRDVRKIIAEAEAVPVYAIFTNEQLAAIVRTKAASKADLSKIDGIGQVKIDKYADKLLTVLRENHEARRQTD